MPNIYKKLQGHNIIRNISKSGLCSRKQALELVKSARVKINGKTILDPGKKPGTHDRISVDGKPLPRPGKRYILFNKPRGCVTTRKDELGRPTVYDIMGNTGTWIFPVGRLDRDSEGLLIFTNDTKFGNVLTDPQYKIKRTYDVSIDGILTQKDIKNILAGIDIGRGEKSRPLSVKITGKDKNSTQVKVVLAEGKNREIRRLFECLKKPVIRLVRTDYGSFLLGSLKPGEWREIDHIPQEILHMIRPGKAPKNP
jgi:pseudouridine synthase